MKQSPTTPSAPENLCHPFRELVGGDVQTTQDKCRRATTAVESTPETAQKPRSASQEGLEHCFQSPDKGGPSVVLIILAGDIITIVFALLWLFRWR
jgi:hypothetical protein